MGPAHQTIEEAQVAVLRRDVGRGLVGHPRADGVHLGVVVSHLAVGHQALHGGVLAAQVVDASAQLQGDGIAVGQATVGLHAVPERLHLGMVARELAVASVVGRRQLEHDHLAVMGARL